MKKLIIMAALLTGMVSFAQQKGERPQMPTAQERVDELKDLNLTEEQKTKIKAIYEKEEAQHKERMESGERPQRSESSDDSSTVKGERPQRPESSDASNVKGERPSGDFKGGKGQNNEEIKAILTDEQYKKYENLQEEKRASFSEKNSNTTSDSKKTKRSKKSKTVSASASSVK